MSGAPKGSFYFHFPDGKRQLAREVLDVYGARVLAGMKMLAAKYDDPAGFVRALCKAMAKEMEATDWTLGCAAQNLALELAPGDREFADALAQTFAGWTSVITDAIRAAYPTRAGGRAPRNGDPGGAGGREDARALEFAPPAPFEAVIDMVVPELRGEGETFVIFAGAASYSSGSVVKNSG